MINGLGNYTEKIWIGIKDGKITRRNKDTQEVDTYTFVEGLVQKITPRQREIKGKKINFLDIDIKNGETLLNLSINRDGGVARDIIRSLANINNFNGIVRISPYKSKKNSDYTNVSVYREGERVTWITDKMLSGEEILDYVEAINKAIADGYRVPDSIDEEKEQVDFEEAPAPDDPFGGDASM